MIKLVLCDNRKNSNFNKLQELFIGDEKYCLVTIPTGIIMGYKCIVPKMYFSTLLYIPHDPEK
jgi:dTDP-4-dehydrorhamnose 3,5-epimerase-like enzyme